MQRAANLLKQAVWLAPLALLVFVTIAAIQAANDSRAADAPSATPPPAFTSLHGHQAPAITPVPTDPAPATAIGSLPLSDLMTATPVPPGYPPPPTSRFPPGYPVPPTLSPEEATAVGATAIARETEYWSTVIPQYTEMAGTSIAQATADAPLYIVGPACAVDRQARFSFFVPDGWNTSMSHGHTTTYNYDSELYGRDGPPPPGLIKVSFYIGSLSPQQTFEQWVSERIASNTPPEGEPPVTFTEPEPYSLGRLSGISYELDGFMGDAEEIILDVPGGRIILIQLVPAASSAEPEALAIFADSLAVSPEEFCH